MNGTEEEWVPIDNFAKNEHINEKYNKTLSLSLSLSLCLSVSKRTRVNMCTWYGTQDNECSTSTCIVVYYLWKVAHMTHKI